MRAAVGARVEAQHAAPLHLPGLWPVNRPGLFITRFSGEGPSRGFSREQRGRRL